MIVRPIIVLGAPRSGTTILHRCLAVHPDLWSLPGESHRVLEGPFHPAAGGYQSNRVVASDVDASCRERLVGEFFESAINLNRVMRQPMPLLTADRLAERVVKGIALRVAGRMTRIRRPPTIRLVEKTPKNTLRVPMLNALFPDALFIWLRRSAEANVRSLARAWRAEDRIGPWKRPRFATYPVASELCLRDYHSPWWRFALVPGWRALRGSTVADVAAWQYVQCTRYAESDLAMLTPDRVFRVEYEQFVEQPVQVTGAILKWADLAPSESVETFAACLPPVNRVDARTRNSQSATANEVREALCRAAERSADSLRARPGSAAAAGPAAGAMFP